MRDTSLAILFWAMMLIAISALIYPWSFRGRVVRVLAHLPLSLLFIYALYEDIMPVEMNIRIDLLMLYPMFAITGLGYAAKLWLLCRRPNDA
ncbi:MAG TPA: hypothetical protein VFD27_07475 [Chthoniobacteraceae bacterium]|nr:hypothetical protein [Chthoniobacteraceae bacterium]